MYKYTACILVFILVFGFYDQEGLAGSLIDIGVADGDRTRDHRNHNQENNVGNTLA